MLTFDLGVYRFPNEAWKLLLIHMTDYLLLTRKAVSAVGKPSSAGFEFLGFSSHSIDTHLSSAYNVLISPQGTRMVTIRQGRLAMN